MSFDARNFARETVSRMQDYISEYDSVGANELLLRSGISDEPRFPDDEDAIRMSLFDMPELDSDVLPRKQRRTK